MNCMAVKIPLISSEYNRRQDAAQLGARHHDQGYECPHTVDEVTHETRAATRKKWQLSRAWFREVGNHDAARVTCHWRDTNGRSIQAPVIQAQSLKPHVEHRRCVPNYRAVSIAFESPRNIQMELMSPGFSTASAFMISLHQHTNVETSQLVYEVYSALINALFRNVGRMQHARSWTTGCTHGDCYVSVLTAWALYNVDAVVFWRRLARVVIHCMCAMVAGPDLWKTPIVALSAANCLPARVGDREILGEGREVGGVWTREHRSDKGWRVGDAYRRAGPIWEVGTRNYVKASTQSSPSYLSAKKLTIEGRGMSNLKDRVAWFGELAADEATIEVYRKSGLMTIAHEQRITCLHLKYKRGHGGVVVRLPTSYLGKKKVRFSAVLLPDFGMCESCHRMLLVGGFYRGSPVSPVHLLRRYPILVSPPTAFESPKLLYSPPSTNFTRLLPVSLVAQFIPVGKYLYGRRGVHIGEKRTECIRFADDKVLLAESERTITKMLKGLNETCEEYGMRINASKTKSMAFSKGRKQANVKIGPVNISQIKAFKYLRSTITADLKCHQEVKTSIAVAKEARIERISWVERLSNEELLERVDERRKLLKVITERKKNCLGHSLRQGVLANRCYGRNSLWKILKGRKRYKLIDEIKGSGKYMDLKRLAEDGRAWRDTTRKSHNEIVRRLHSPLPIHSTGISAQKSSAPQGQTVGPTEGIPGCKCFPSRDGWHAHTVFLPPIMARSALHRHHSDPPFVTAQKAGSLKIAPKSNAPGDIEYCPEIRATVAELLDYSPPTKANRVQTLPDPPRIFGSGNRAGRCHWLLYYPLTNNAEVVLFYKLNSVCKTSLSLWPHPDCSGMSPLVRGVSVLASVVDMACLHHSSIVKEYKLNK
ncbi:hypothetical protein PR048_023300 [Dryococelus australis]|uniref:Reverse transcriptase domain-containing protein n=1 Tax=Dryococelus australis TaxID=614101 RepID=A0ABQ9GTP4_9NEOP|nr:hypothetical protein PR048_023300 [Dryococelus australis]